MAEKKSDESKLGKAVQEGDLKALKKMLGSEDIKRDRKGINDALVQAVLGRNNEAVEALLAAGANPEQVTAAGTLLMCAALDGSLGVVKSLIRAGANVNRQWRGETALSAAFSENQTATIKFLEGVGAEAPPTVTLLHAATHGRMERVEKALKKGAEVDKPGGMFRETALVAAARGGHLKVVQLLLGQGANPNKKVEQESALHSAIAYGKRLDVAKALVEAGADPKIRYYGQNMAIAAAEAGQLDILKWVVEKGVDPNYVDKETGTTALDLAKSNKHKEVIAWLQGLGAAGVRDEGRKIVRALAREFGGRPQEHSYGFLLNGKLAGYSCQFHVDATGGGVGVRKIKFRAGEAGRLGEGALFWAAAEPDSRFGKAVKVKKTGIGKGVNAWRTAGTKEITEGFVREFTLEHRARLEALKLATGEEAGISSQVMFLSWQGTELGRIMEQVRAFEDLISAVFGKAQPERQLFEKEWFFKATGAAAGRGNAPQHHFGGELSTPVVCPGCGGGINLMAEIDLTDPALPRGVMRTQKLPLFWCLTCLEWDPVFYQLSGATPKPIDANGKELSPKKGGEGEGGLARRRAMLVPVAPGKMAGGKSKVGGKPKWIQTDVTPDCPRCRKAMAFAAQLASDKSVTYADMGMLYGFVCPECEVVATLVQSH